MSLSVVDVEVLSGLAYAQVRLFSNRDMAQALAAGDVWAAVGWSGDLVPVAQRSGNVHIVAPSSGTALWANLWVVPSFATHGDRVRLPHVTPLQCLKFLLTPLLIF